MTRVVDEIMVCLDCYMAIAIGDISGIDDNKRVSAVNAAVSALSERGYPCAGDGENDHEFSWRACECCDCSLGGSRHQVVILGDDDPTAEMDCGF